MKEKVIFDIGTIVKIIPINIKGQIKRISISESGVEYGVRYFNNNKPYDYFFIQSELENYE